MALAAYGLDCDALCRNAQLDQHSLRDPDASVNLDTWWPSGAPPSALPLDPVLGVNVAKVARSIQPSSSGTPSCRAQSCRFLAPPSRPAAHHLPRDVVSLYEMGIHVEVRFARPGGFSAASHHSLDYNVSYSVRWFRTFFGVVPRYITFRHPAPAGGPTIRTCSAHRFTSLGPRTRSCCTRVTSNDRGRSTARPRSTVSATPPMKCCAS
jgi:hypothetical protein